MSTNVISPHALFFIVVVQGGEAAFALLFSYTLSWMDGCTDGWVMAKEERMDG
jgi:hypothetical protein